MRLGLEWSQVSQSAERAVFFAGFHRATVSVSLIKLLPRREEKTSASSTSGIPESSLPIPGSAKEFCCSGGASLRFKAASGKVLAA